MNWKFAGHGVLAGLVAVAAGDAVAAVINPAASPVLAVGSQVVDLTPRPVKEWAVAWFGTADKAVLVGSVLIGTIALAALAGLVSARRPAAGAGVLAAMGLGVAVLVHRLPEAIPALLTIPVGVATLLLLRARAVDTNATRRTLLAGAGFLGLAAALGVTGSALRRRRATPIHVTLPQPAEPLRPLPRGLGREGITPFVSANRDFYRIDTSLSTPIVDPDLWSLTIDGDVGRTVRYTYAQLLRMPLIERDITLACVSNPVGGPYAGGARWLGVRLADLLKPARHPGPQPWGRADQILSTAVGGMTISTPLDLATDGRDSMIAIGMNGAPLPRDHGFPARLIVPGLYGFIGATKWVTRLTLTRYADHEAYWTPRGWATDAPIKIASRIDTPRDADRTDVGEVVVGGIAWAHSNGGVAGVQVRVDDGPWHDAQLGPSGGVDYWRQWFWRWPARPGTHQVQVRAVAADGTHQTPAVVDAAPDGATGWHTVNVSVS